jgi:hypothetical protein
VSIAASRIKSQLRRTNNNERRGRMKFKCLKCSKIFIRDGRLKPYKGRKYIYSSCGENGLPVRCYVIKEDKQ